MGKLNEIRGVPESDIKKAAAKILIFAFIVIVVSLKGIFL